MPDLLNITILAIILTTIWVLLAGLFSWKYGAGYDISGTLIEVLVDLQRERYQFKNIFLMNSANKNCMQAGLFNFKKIFISTALVPEWHLVPYIIAHEMGHVKLKHLEKYLVLFFINSFLVLFLWSGINNLLGIENYFIRLATFLIVFWPSGFIASFFTKRFEHQADLYAIKNYNLNPEFYLSALRNITGPQPKKLFKTHPTLEERAAYLKKNI